MRTVLEFPLVGRLLEARVAIVGFLHEEVLELRVVRWGRTLYRSAKGKWEVPLHVFMRGVGRLGTAEPTEESAGICWNLPLVKMYCEPRSNRPMPFCSM